MTNKFKKGDKAKITGNTNSHNFEIGEVVILRTYRTNGIWKCYHLDRRDFWHVKESDMEPYETTEQPTEKPLTLQEKFEQGWSMVYKNGTNPVVTELRTIANGKIVAYYSDGDAAVWDENIFHFHHTITPPAPKVERRFTGIHCDENCITWCGVDFDTHEVAKLNTIMETTCILEHEKQGDKWVFVKAHTV